jgi:hypothetical protein
LSGDDEPVELETDGRRIYKIRGSHGGDDISLPASPYGVTSKKTNIN